MFDIKNYHIGLEVEKESFYKVCDWDSKADCHKHGVFTVNTALVEYARSLQDQGYSNSKVIAMTVRLANYRANKAMRGDCELYAIAAEEWASRA